MDITPMVYSDYLKSFINNQVIDLIKDTLDKEDPDKVIDIVVDTFNNGLPSDTEVMLVCGLGNIANPLSDIIMEFNNWSKDISEINVGFSYYLLQYYPGTPFRMSFNLVSKHAREYILGGFLITFIVDNEELKYTVNLFDTEFKHH